MPIDSFNVSIISQIIGTVEGTLTSWFRLVESEGVVPFLACALGTLTPRAPLGTLTPRAQSGPYIYPAYKYSAVKSLLG